MHYAPPDQYGLAIEVIDADELRDRVARIPNRGIERVDFLFLLYVHGGRYRHMVDFETFACSAGSCLLVRPGRVHRFGDEQNWDGWMVILHADLFGPRPRTSAAHGAEGLADPFDLSTHLQTSEPSQEAIFETIHRMRQDAARAEDPGAVNLLLRAQLQVLLTRPRLEQTDQSGRLGIDPIAFERHRAFRRALEEHFRRCHKAATYARELHCSVRTLNRSTVRVTGQTAKAHIVNRIMLEARRLLVHTTLPVSTIHSHGPRPATGGRSRSCAWRCHPSK
ncbi:MAG: helix-turn-helix transcriptional regulator [Nitriliruptoraceae bacterium]